MVMTSKISISVEDLAVEYTSFEGRILSTARTKKFTAISGISLKLEKERLLQLLEKMELVKQLY